MTQAGTTTSPSQGSAQPEYAVFRHVTSNISAVVLFGEKKGWEGRRFERIQHRLADDEIAINAVLAGLHVLEGSSNIDKTKLTVLKSTLVELRDAIDTDGISLLSTTRIVGNRAAKLAKELRANPSGFISMSDTYRLFARNMQSGRADQSSIAAPLLRDDASKQQLDTATTILWDLGQLLGQMDRDLTAGLGARFGAYGRIRLGQFSAKEGGASEYLDYLVEGGGLDLLATHVRRNTANMETLVMLRKARKMFGDGTEREKIAQWLEGYAATLPAPEQSTISM